MKKLIAILTITASVGFITSCKAQTKVIVVKERPVAPATVIVRQGPPPFAGAIWVGEEWELRGGRYEYVAPHYVHPRRSGVWVPGHWRGKHEGYTWVGGHWR